MTSSSAPPWPPARKVMSGVDDNGRTVAASTTCLGTACSRSGRLTLSGGVDLADRHQRICHPLFERRSISAAAAGSGDERALDDDVLILGKCPCQGSASIIEAEETPGESARGPLVGVIPCGLGEFADLLGGPVCGLLCQLCVRLRLGHFDEGLHLVERELPLGERIGDVGERGKASGSGHPFACGGGGDAAPLDEPGHHGGGAVDAPRPPAVQFGDSSQKLTLVCGDRPVMMGDARNEGFGSPRHRGRSRSVLHEGGCHAGVNGRRERTRTPATRGPNPSGRFGQRYRSACTHSPWLRTGTRAGR